MVGAVPLVGDLFDLGFKANRRNVRLLHRHLAERGALARAGRGRAARAARSNRSEAAPLAGLVEARRICQF